MRGLKQKFCENFHLALAWLIVKACDVDRVPVGYASGTAGYTDRELAELYGSIADGCFLAADNAAYFHLAEINAIWFALNHRYGAARAREEWTAGKGADELALYIERYRTLMTYPAERVRAIEYMGEKVAREG